MVEINPHFKQWSNTCFSSNAARCTQNNNFRNFTEHENSSLKNLIIMFFFFFFSLIHTRCRDYTTTYSTYYFGLCLQSEKVFFLSVFERFCALRIRESSTKARQRNLKLNFSAIAVKSS